jgi:hypothetical protein
LIRYAARAERGDVTVKVLHGASDPRGRTEFAQVLEHQ